MRMRLRMLKHCVGKGRHVMKQLHVCLISVAIVATERAGYVLYRALVLDCASIYTMYSTTLSLSVPCHGGNHADAQ